MTASTATASATHLMIQVHHRRFMDVAFILALVVLTFACNLSTCDAFHHTSLSNSKRKMIPTSSSSSSSSSSFSFSSSQTTRQNSQQQRRQQSSSSSSLLRMSSTAKKAPGTAKLDTPWEELGFVFRPTNSHVKLQYRDGEWMEPELVQVRIKNKMQ
jgi:hypothetical protein